MELPFSATFSMLRRSPCGERGLKWPVTQLCVLAGTSLPVRGAWIEIVHGAQPVGMCPVAPRAGSVD